MEALSDQNVLRREHVKHTVGMLHSYSAGLAKAVEEGRCAVVGLEYDLAEGSARMVNVIGEVGEQPAVLPQAG
jgi:carbonic anhydrase